jgi:hypothetical protein
MWFVNDKYYLGRKVNNEPKVSDIIFGLNLMQPPGVT